MFIVEREIHNTERKSGKRETGPAAEIRRFPEIEPLDRRHFWTAASQHLGQRFGRWRSGSEVWRSGFVGLDRSCFW